MFAGGGHHLHLAVEDPLVVLRLDVRIADHLELIVGVIAFGFLTGHGDGGGGRVLLVRLGHHGGLLLLFLGRHRSLLAVHVRLLLGVGGGFVAGLLVRPRLRIGLLLLVRSHRLLALAVLGGLTLLLLGR